jgi:hypothetical protein
MNLLRRFTNWLQPKLPYLNVILVIGCYIGNQYFVQGFCQPVAWVWWVLVPSVWSFLVWPWLRQVPRLRYPLLFLQGAFLLVCLYCTVFAGPYLLLTLFFGFLGFPLLMWAPVVFGIQVVRRAWVSPLPAARWVFGAGMLPLLLAQVWAWGQYRQVEAAVATLPVAQRHEAGPLLRVVPRTYMAERLAGQLFKYHASPEMIFDGWRPPLHDPLVNVCMAADFMAHFGQPEAAHTGPLIIGRWNLNYGGYRESDINTQAAFYHQLFPNEPIKVDCACAHTGDAEGYYVWKPGQTDGWGTSLAEVARQQRETEAFLRSQADSAAANTHSPSRP